MWLIFDGCRPLHCGNGDWQREYSQLHRNILAGKAAQRYLLASGENGAQLHIHQQHTCLLVTA